MDRLPRELADEILLQCVNGSPKNMVLPLRLVCRQFDRTLKPYACRTLGLEFSRLSKSTNLRRPQMDALQTIGYHCKCLYVDLMVLRDELEVEFLTTVLDRVPAMTDFLASLRQKYCMNEASFTEADFYNTLEEMLFNCREIDSLRLNLPFQLIGISFNAATMILANTLKAFANRPEEDSAWLKTLVVENVTDIAICDLWLNPSDVLNIMRVVAVLENLVLTLRRHESEALQSGLFGACLWNVVEHAEHLQTLSIAEIDHDGGGHPAPGLRLTRHTQQSIDDFQARLLPSPRLILISALRCLELKRVLISADFLINAAHNFGSTLEELYLTEVYMAIEQTPTWNTNCQRHLWIGLPNTQPPSDTADDSGRTTWVAMAFRALMPHLRIIRATGLGYHLHTSFPASLEHDPTSRAFDLQDPAGLSRPLSRRFVEVVSGITQPPTRGTKTPMVFYAHEAEHAHLLKETKPRPRQLCIEDYDTLAHQLENGSTTSDWLRSIDGVFVNCNTKSLDELHFIANTACQGMGELPAYRGDGEDTQQQQQQQQQQQEEDEDAGAANSLAMSQ